MTKLKTKFRKYGHDFTQVERSENHAIYEQRINGLQGRFEVIRVQRYTLDGKTANTPKIGTNLEALESYPTASDWGRLGWTFFSLSEAKKKFNELESKPCAV